MSSRERSPVELGEDLDEIKATLAELRSELRQGFVPRELYEARHTGLRSEIALEMANMRNETASVRSIAERGSALAMWCFGLLAAAVIVAMVGFLATGGGT